MQDAAKKYNNLIYSWVKTPPSCSFLESTIKFENDGPDEIISTLYKSHSRHNFKFDFSDWNSDTTSLKSTIRQVSLLFPVSKSPQTLYVKVNSNIGGYSSTESDVCELKVTVAPPDVNPRPGGECETEREEGERERPKSDCDI